MFKFKKALSILALALCSAILLAGCKSGQPKFVDIKEHGSRTDDPVGFQFEKPAKDEEYVLMKTSKGDIKIRLFPKSAPIAAENFRLLVKKGYYDGVSFHRVVENFMIQGGDPEGTGSGGESAWGGTFGYEYNANLRHFRGALSMAHSQLPNSNGSQFFIVQNKKVEENVLDYYKTVWDKATYDLYKAHGGTPSLDGTDNETPYSVFGQVFEGLDVVDALASVETKLDSTQREQSVPVEEIKIIKATLEKYQ